MIAALASRFGLSHDDFVVTAAISARVIGSTISRAIESTYDVYIRNAAPAGKDKSAGEGPGKAVTGRRQRIRDHRSSQLGLAPRARQPGADADPAPRPGAEGQE
jgi:hypothetical protein